MTVGISHIASYLPNETVDNEEQAKKFEITKEFLYDKIGVRSYRVLSPTENTSDMALKALEALASKCGESLEDIDILVVVTQNPDSNLPHVSGLVHGRANIQEKCITFDLSLGCSGYVYGLQVVKSLIESLGLQKGVLITADPYSKIVDKEDKNTSLLFGDGAVATLLDRDPIIDICTESFSYYSKGDLKGALAVEDGVLNMDGRAVFSFAATKVPPLVQECVVKSGLEYAHIDKYLFHQGSAYIVDTLRKKIGLSSENCPLDIAQCGNLVSSSVAKLLEDTIGKPEVQNLLLCGFGVGLSAAAVTLKRRKT